MAPGLEHVGGRQRSLPHGETADFWIPLSLNPANLNRNFRGLNTVARLGSGVSIEQANAELDRLARSTSSSSLTRTLAGARLPVPSSSTSSAVPGPCCWPSSARLPVSSSSLAATSPVSRSDGQSRGRVNTRYALRSEPAVAGWRERFWSSRGSWRCSARVSVSRSPLRAYERSSNWLRPTCRGCTRSGLTWVCSSSAAPSPSSPACSAACFPPGTAHERTSRKPCERAAERERQALAVSVGTARSSSRRSRSALSFWSALDSWRVPFYLRAAQSGRVQDPGCAHDDLRSTRGGNTVRARRRRARGLPRAAAYCPARRSRAFSPREPQRGCRLRLGSTARTLRAWCDSTSQRGPWRPTSGHSPGWK